jgi:hypothetical protein
MKVNFVLLFVPATLMFCLSNCKKSSSSSDINLTIGLIAYYPFNGNANDASGNKLNGTVVGGVTFTNDANGKANSAATFDGSTGYILVSDSAGKFQTNAVSISFLVNLTNTSIRQSFLANQNFNDGTGLSYAVVLGTANTSLPQFGVETNTLGCGAPPYDLSADISPANQMSTNKWYNIVCIFTDSLQEFFVNGTLNTAITRNFAALNQCLNNKDLVIGAWWSGDLIPVNGSMDELRIYNRALNKDEINQLAKAVQ